MKLLKAGMAALGVLASIAVQAQQGPTLDQFKAQSALARKLKDQYEKQVRLRYGLTAEIADSITFEALDRGWPLPRRER